MKKLLTFIMFMATASMSYCQMYENQHPGLIHKVAPAQSNNHPTNLPATAPVVDFGWQKVDVSGINIVFDFNEYTLFKGSPKPALSFTPGIAWFKGAGKGHITVQNNVDTIIDLHAVAYYGFALTGGITNLWGQLYTPTPVKASFRTCLIGGINNFALNAGIEWLDVNNNDKTIISPSFQVGLTTNLRDLFTAWTSLSLPKAP